MKISNDDKLFKKWFINVEEGQYFTKFKWNNSFLKIPPNIVFNGELISEIFGGEINPFEISIKYKIILNSAPQLKKTKKVYG